MGYYITKIEVEGFKIFNSLISFDLDSNVVFIIGPVGVGKTSLLKAIEFGLYGSVYNFVGGTLRRVKIEDLINDFSDESKVSLELKDVENNDIIRLIRVRGRKGREWLKIYKNNKPINKEEFENLIDISHEDFKRQVYIQSSLLRDIIEVPPSRRSEALDRLFGIETLEEVFKSVPIKLVDESSKRFEDEIHKEKALLLGLEDIKEEDIKGLEESLYSIRSELNSLRREKNLIERRTKQMESQRNEYYKLEGLVNFYRNKLSEIKKETESFRGELVSEVELKIDIENLFEDIAVLLEDLFYAEKAEEIRKTRIREISINTIDKLRDLTKLFSSIRGELEDELSKLMEERYEFERRFSSLRNKLNELSFKEDFLRPYVSRYKELIRKYGSVSSIKKIIENIDDEILRSRKRSEIEHAKVVILEDLLNKIKRMGRVLCPICGSEITSEKELEKRREKSLSSGMEGLLKRISELERKRDEYRKTLKELYGILDKTSEYERITRNRKEVEDEIKKYEGLMDEAEEEIDTMRDKISRIVETIDSTNKILEKATIFVRYFEKAKEEKNVKDNINKLEMQLKSINFDPKKYGALRNKLKEIETRELELSFKVKQIEEEIKRKKKILEKRREIESKIVELNERLKKLGTLKNKLIKVKYSYRSIQGELRRNFLNKIRNYMNSIFSEVYIYNDFDGLDIRVLNVSSQLISRSVYEIYAHRKIDNEWLPMYTRLSDGQISIASLSFILALFSLSSHNLSVIIMDDPLQNVDYNCKRAWIKSLLDWSKVKQKIIASQDVRILDILRREKFKGKIYELRHGDRRGPTVKAISC